MKIAYVTTYDPADRSNWSGLGEAIMRCLEGAGFEVTPLGPLDDAPSFGERLVSRARRVVSGGIDDLARGPGPTRRMARQVSAKLTAAKFDLVFSPGSVPVARLDCPQPIVTWSDATFVSLIGHYPGYENLTRNTVVVGRRTERLAFDRAALSIFASEWAARSAEQDYGVDRAKIEVLPFGANFGAPPARDQVLANIAGRAVDRIELLSVGIDWTRKGMDRAVALAEALNQRGQAVRLTIVGCWPAPGIRLPPFVELAGFIDKRTPEGEAALMALFQRSHFHVLFTEAECFGVVFSEANAYATPNIASDVGGVGSAVREGKGGWLVDPATPIETIADRVVACLADPDAYRSIAEAARAEYDTRLNWAASSEVLRRRLPQLLADGISR